MEGKKKKKRNRGQHWVVVVSQLDVCGRRLSEARPWNVDNDDDGGVLAYR
jgi:hypothetical protein